MMIENSRLVEGSVELPSSESLPRRVESVLQFEELVVDGRGPRPTHSAEMRRVHHLGGLDGDGQLHRS